MAVVVGTVAAVAVVVLLQSFFTVYTTSRLAFTASAKRANLNNDSKLKGKKSMSPLFEQCDTHTHTQMHAHMCIRTHTDIKTHNNHHWQFITLSEWTVF